MLEPGLEKLAHFEIFRELLNEFDFQLLNLMELAEMLKKKSTVTTLTGAWNAISSGGVQVPAHLPKQQNTRGVTEKQSQGPKPGWGKDKRRGLYFPSLHYISTFLTTKIH